MFSLCSTSIEIVDDRRELGSEAYLWFKVGYVDANNGSDEDNIPDDFELAGEEEDYLPSDEGEIRKSSVDPVFFVDEEAV